MPFTADTAALYGRKGGLTTALLNDPRVYTRRGLERANWGRFFDATDANLSHTERVRLAETARALFYQDQRIAVAKKRRNQK